MNYTVNEANVYWQDIILLFVEVSSLLRYNKISEGKFCSFYMFTTKLRAYMYLLFTIRNTFIVFNGLTVKCNGTIYIEIIPNKF